MTPVTAISTLHPNNPHQGRYDFKHLCDLLPALKAFVMLNPKGEQTIDFANAKAVVCLNQALLKQHYALEHWSLPAGFLCPPIPGRADYVHHVAQLLSETLPPQRIRMLDIGTGANLIYPIIAKRTFDWDIVASDIDAKALQNAQHIIHANALTGIQLRHQTQSEHIFQGIVQAGEQFDVTFCNPPFFKSAQEANKQASRKWRNLKGAKAMNMRNFGGQQNELWCEGGELAFLRRMIAESAECAQQIKWFTSLVSNQEHLPLLEKALKRQQASVVKILSMSQGQKRSHILAWSFVLS